MATWETLLSTMGLALVSGGTVSLVYGFLLSFVGNVCIAMSLSEPASMHPNAGGQYFMISELSSSRTRAILSFYTGWISLLGWVALTASAPFGAANIIQGVVVLNYEDYVPQTWHWYLIYVAVTLIAFGLNIFGGRVLPVLENLIMALHVIFFFMILIATLVLARGNYQPAEFVFTQFSNGTGWDSDFVAWGIGMVTSAYIMIGYDSAAHMAEEMPDPRRGVPRAMIGSIIVNGIMGFAIVIAVLFSIQDFDAALSARTGFPIIEIFRQLTGGSNLAAASAMSCTIAVSAALATVGLVASTSRTLWSFARDGAPAFSGKIARISRRTHVPFNAVAVVIVAVLLLGALNVASTAGFSAVLSITVVGLSLSYLVPIVAMLYRRLRTPDMLAWGPWRMNPVVGVAVNVASIVYVLFLTALLVLPTTVPVVAANMNYASLILGGVVILVSVDWVLRARKSFKGPVALVDV
ncbi:amino acid/polyamine transporter I [Microdochium trichocladiopsis]|uniref:Amino acid/polyamine transporter I n=1 Tax=Microdochium trichocladiopsis TaxID=1682393 RepID=A0A9P8Y6C2_9PEZI|nr:amino acid/polyamine transporter I [Microdochium trichocladiopsis]KAH7028897.1 amino acid/polyamine transporter I [Microdochium trichocladiopsis]